jgi:hypothetical protein
LHLFSFFSAHDFQVWFFDWVPEFLHNTFRAFELFEIFFFNSVLSLISETESSLLEWSSTVFFVWLKGLFISRISYSFSWGFSYLCSTPLLCFVLSLINISPFYSARCFSLVFVEVLSEFLYLILCLLMLFIFGVLKLLKCILYILVSHV